MKHLGPVSKALQAQTVTAEPDEEEEEEEVEPVPVKRTRGKDKQPRGPRKKQKGSNSDSQGRQRQEPAPGLAPFLSQPAPLVLAVNSCACSLMSYQNSARICSAPPCTSLGGHNSRAITSSISWQLRVVRLLSICHPINGHTSRLSFESSI